jgi:hypothetical protein
MLFDSRFVAILPPPQKSIVSRLEEEDKVSSGFTAGDGNSKNALIRPVLDRAMI